jgi:hypothetical protein
MLKYFQSTRDAVCHNIGAIWLIPYVNDFIYEKNLIVSDSNQKLQTLNSQVNNVHHSISVEEIYPSLARPTLTQGLVERLWTVETDLRLDALILHCYIRFFYQVSIISSFLKLLDLYLRYIDSIRNDINTTADSKYNVKGELNIS